MIPRFSQKLDDMPFDSFNKVNQYAETIFYETHKEGINLRHFGRIRSFVKSKGFF